MEAATLPSAELAEWEARGTVSLGFYDLTCPFCYIAQSKNAILTGLGVAVVELTFQAHPEIPDVGLHVGPRSGPMYEVIEAAAREAGLPLRWQSRLPNSRQALAAAEWARRFASDGAEVYRRSLFAAHFADGLHIDNIDVLLDRAAEAGLDPVALRTALTDGSALRAASEAEQLGRDLGVTGTPTWSCGGAKLIGNRPTRDFERFAADALRRAA